MPGMKMREVGRAVTEHDLAQAEAAVAHGRRNIERQLALIAALERDGHDTAQAVKLLRLFRERQAEHEGHWHRLRAELAQQHEFAAAAGASSKAASD